MTDIDIGTKRLNAFLALIRSAENGGKSGPEVYRASYGGYHFMKVSDHPRKTHTRWGHSSDAAGAYEIKSTTYDDARKHGIAHNFDNDSQDRIALWLIQRKGASTYITNGDYDSAYSLLCGTWSSLPGGRAPEITQEDADQFIKDQLGQ